MSRTAYNVSVVILFLSVGYFATDSIALGDDIDLIVNQSMSTVTISALGQSDDSSVTGDGVVNLEPPSEPFGTAHVTSLNLTMADGFIIDTVLVDVIVKPNGASVFFTEVGMAGTVDGR